MRAIIKSGCTGYETEVHLEPEGGGELFNLTEFLDINEVDVSIRAGELNQARLGINTVGLVLGIERCEIDVEYLIEQLARCIGINRMMTILKELL
jgi:hypothetical protein